MKRNEHQKKVEKSLNFLLTRSVNSSRVASLKGYDMSKTKKTYAYTHRRNHEMPENGVTMLFARIGDREGENNRHYGETCYVLRDEATAMLDLRDPDNIPQKIIDIVKEELGCDDEGAIGALAPEDVVDCGGLWESSIYDTENMMAISRIAELGDYYQGALLPDGAVLFDRDEFFKEGRVEVFEGEIFDDEGNLIV